MPSEDYSSANLARHACLSLVQESVVNTELAIQAEVHLAFSYNMRKVAMLDCEKKFLQSLEESVDDRDVHQKVVALLRKYSSMWHGNLGDLRAIERRISLKPRTSPVRQLTYRAGQRARQITALQIDKMECTAVIERAQSEWAVLW